MLWMKRVSAVLLVGLFSAQAHVADAQPTGQNQGQNQGNDVELRNQRTANLSGADQLREATHVIENMTSLRRRVSDMLDLARQERDIIKVNCLNDKLTQVDVTLRSAREHQELLQTAVSINNDGQRNHEFTLLNIFRSRSTELENQAHQCVGEDTNTFENTASTRMFVSPEIPQSDTTTLTPETLAPDRPLVTSPVM
jgi:hypothetical protein